MNKPEISVVIVSDYAGGGEKSWNDLRGTLTALAQQDATVNAEWLLCENKGCGDSMPGDFGFAFPNVKPGLSDNAGYRAVIARLHDWQGCVRCVSAFGEVGAKFRWSCSVPSWFT